MLNVLRKNSQHWLVMVLIVVVIVGLALFFGYSSRDTGGGQSWAAKVDGETIKMGEFLTRYRNMVERYRKQMGPSFNEQLLESLNIRGRILQDMVYERIIAKEAARNNIKVSDEELREAIASVPYFQKDGKFNVEYYKTILNYNRTSPQEFEKMQRQELVGSKLRNIIASSGKVTDEEVIAGHSLENTKISLAVFKVEVPVLSLVDVSDAEIQKYLSSYGKKEAENYYTSHNEEFKKDGKVITFDKAKQDIARKLILKTKQEELMETKKDQALKLNDIAKASALFKQKVQDTGLFSRSVKSIPSLVGANSNDVLWAFGLKKGQMYSRQIAGVAYIVAVKQVQEDSFNKDSKDFKTYKEKFVLDRGNEEYSSYLEGLRKNWASKIRYSPALANSFGKDQ